MSNLFHPPQLSSGGLYEQINGQPVRALSWNQPFGSLMLPPRLKNETRSRSTHVRGWVLICTCKRDYSNETIRSISGARQFNRIYEIAMSNDGLPNHQSGAAIGIGWLNNSHPMQQNDEDKCFVQYKPGLWVWKFENVRAIKPFGWKGKQGWSLLDAETIKKIIVL